MNNVIKWSHHKIESWISWVEAQESTKLNGYLAKYNIEHETINVDLNDKPLWLEKLNQADKVPILDVVEGGKSSLITESAEIIKFLSGHFGNEDLTLDEKDQTYSYFMNRVVTQWYQVVYFQKQDETTNLIDAFDTLNDLFQTKFLSGSTVGLADYNIWVKSIHHTENYYV